MKRIYPSTKAYAFSINVNRITRKDTGIRTRWQGYYVFSTSENPPFVRRNMDELEKRDGSRLKKLGKKVNLRVFRLLNRRYLELLLILRSLLKIAEIVIDRFKNSPVSYRLRPYTRTHTHNTRFSWNSKMASRPVTERRLIKTYFYILDRHFLYGGPRKRIYRRSRYF